MSLAALSVVVVILATGCAATKNNIHMDEKGYSNTGWQFGTPTIDTHTPGMNFRKPVMMPAPAGYQNQQTQPAPQQNQWQPQGQPQALQQNQQPSTGQSMVVPDVSSICPTCDVQVASSDWSGSSSGNVQPARQQYPQVSQQQSQPQYLMAWEEGASEAAQPGQSVIWYGGTWTAGWGDGCSSGGSYCGGSGLRPWFQPRVREQRRGDCDDYGRPIRRGPGREDCDGWGRPVQHPVPHQTQQRQFSQGSFRQSSGSHQTSGFGGHSRPH